MLLDQVYVSTTKISIGTFIDNTYGRSDRTDIDTSIAVVILNVHYNFCKARMARNVCMYVCMYVCIQFYISQ